MPEQLDPAQKQQTTEQAQMVRVLEALCGADFPTPHETKVREALALHLAKRWGLRHPREEIVPSNRQAPPPTTRKAS